MADLWGSVKQLLGAVGIEVEKGQESESREGISSSQAGNARQPFGIESDGGEDIIGVEESSQAAFVPRAPNGAVDKRTVAASRRSSVGSVILSGPPPELNSHHRSEQTGRKMTGLEAQITTEFSDGRKPVSMSQVISMPIVNPGYNQRSRRASLVEAKAVSRRGSIVEGFDLDCEGVERKEKKRERSKSMIEQKGVMYDLMAESRKWEEKNDLLRAKVYHYQKKFDAEEKIYDALMYHGRTDAAGRVEAVKLTGHIAMANRDETGRDKTKVMASMNRLEDKIQAYEYKLKMHSYKKPDAPKF